MKYLITAIAAVVLVGCGEANLSKDELALFDTVKSPTLDGKSSKIEAIKKLIESGINVSAKEKSIYRLRINEGK